MINIKRPIVADDIIAKWLGIIDQLDPVGGRLEGYLSQVKYANIQVALNIHLSILREKLEGCHCTPKAGIRRKVSIVVNIRKKE